MAKRVGNIENLKPFKKGNPGGPGRPPKVRDDIITKKALELLLKPHPTHKGKTRLEVLAEKWIERGETGEGFSEILDRVDGKLPEKTEATVNVTSDPTDDPELDGWAEQRVRAKQAKEADSPAQPGGLRSPDEQGEMAVDEAPGSAE